MGFSICVLDEILQGNIDGLPKWEPCSLAGIYLGHLTFYSGAVSLVLNPATSHVSPQYHVVFNDEFSTVPFMREGTKPPIWIDLVQRISKSVSTENIDPKDTWFTPDLGEGLI